MYTIIALILGAIVLGLALKFFFPHRINRFLAGETYPDDDTFRPPSNPDDILEGLPTGVFVLNEDLVVTYANSSFAKELGTLRNELLDSTLEEIFDVSEGLKQSLMESPEDHGENAAPRNRAQVIYHDEKGGKIKLQLIFSRINEDNGTQYICMVPTMTDLDASRDQLRKTERLKALGEMVSGLAHEINNPLTGVVGFANLLLETDEDSPHEQELKIIQKNAQRCKDIIENMLGFIRSEEPESDDLDINEILDSTIKLTRRDLDINDIEITRNLDPELPSLKANRTQLEEIFVNLLNNAKDELKNHPKEDRKISVKTKPADKNKIVVTVEDSGSGIPENERDKIFEPFFTHKKTGEGTGLGLPIVQGIVSGLEGEISVSESEMGGAKFEVALPTGESRKKLEGQATRASHSQRLPTDLKDMMVIEDEESIRHLFDKFGEENNLRREFFENPLQAIEYLNHRRPEYDPDVIFLDLIFPGKLRGRDFVDWVEENRASLLDRIIVMTGNPDDDQINLIEKHENIPLITKPLNFSELIQTINQRQNIRSE